MKAPVIDIRDICYYLPDRIVTNEELAEGHPSWQMDRVVARTGVSSRHIAAPGQTAFDLALVAASELLERNQGLRQAIDGIIFCTQTGDYVMPPNACLLQAALKLSDEVLAFDINHACSGYVYSLALAQGLVSAGTCTNILLVTADTYSALIHPGDRAARTLFGDGAAVTWIAGADGPAGIVDLLCATAGDRYEAFYVPAGGRRQPSSSATRVASTDANGNTRTAESIHMDGLGVLSVINSKVPGQVRRLLERNDLQIEDLDLVIFHQASQVALDALAHTLQVPNVLVFNNLANVGNTVSASIPIAIAAARAGGQMRGGSRVLLSGFGVGISWASALLVA